MKKSLFVVFAFASILFFGCKPSITVTPEQKGNETSGKTDTSSSEQSKKENDKENSGSDSKPETETETLIGEKISIPISVQPSVASAPLKVKGADRSIENTEMSVVYTEASGSGASDGTMVTSSDGVLKITPTENGLLIVKTHPESWEHNTIHVKNVTRGYENFKVDNVNQNTNTIPYPFVKAGDVYEVWIEKQETGWTNWGETKKTQVTAVGGMGDMTLSFDRYYYNPADRSITFKDFTIKIPENYESIINQNSIYFDGAVFNGKPWTTGVKENYGVNYTLDKSKLTLSGTSEVTDFIDSAVKLGNAPEMAIPLIDRSFTFKYRLLAEIIYDSTKTGEIIPLTGGVELPKVTITPVNGYFQNPTTYHFGNNWQAGNFIKIEDLSDSGNNLSETSVSLKDRGNSTKWTAKVPYSIKFDEKTKVMGMPKSKRWVLMANYFDRSLIRTDFAGYLGNYVFNSYWNATFKPVNLYMGETFLGTYDIGECNKIEKNRVNVQNLADYADGKSLADVNGDGKTDIEDCGFMVEIDTAINYEDTLNSSNYKTKVGVDGYAAERIYFYSYEKCIPMTLKSPDFDDSMYSDEVCQQMGEYAKSKIDAFEKMLYSDDFDEKFTDYIDVLSFIDWYLVNEFGKNSDANFQKSVPVTYDPSDGKLHMGPNWDFDLAFGNFDHDYQLPDNKSSYVSETSGWYINGGMKWCDENDLYCDVNNTTRVQTWWINRLFESQTFKKAVKARWMDRRLYLKNAVNQQILNYANMVNDSIDANEAICPRIGVYEWNGPSDYASRKTYEEEVTYLYDWCIARYNWMDSEISRW